MANGEVIVSGSIVKFLASSIVTCLIAIGGYMVVWNADDAAFKSKVLVHLGNLDKEMLDVKEILKTVPPSNQKVTDLSERLRRLEDVVYQEQARSK